MADLKLPGFANIQDLTVENFLECVDGKSYCMYTCITVQFYSDETLKVL